MLHFHVSDTPKDATCVFRFNGRDLGRGSTSLSVPLSLLRGRESEQCRPFLCEFVDVEIVGAHQSMVASMASNSDKRLGELRLPLSSLVPVTSSAGQLTASGAPVTARSPGKQYKVAPSTSSRSVYSVHIEMWVQDCDKATSEALLKIIPSPRLQLSDLLPPHALQYRHLFVELENDYECHTAGHSFDNCMAGALSILPGPRVGEVVLDRRELVEFRPFASGSLNAFGDKSHWIARGELIITDLRVLFLPFEMLWVAPWAPDGGRTAITVPRAPIGESPSAPAVDVEALVAFRKATFQLWLGAVESCRFLPSNDLSGACSLLIESRDQCCTEFVVKRGNRQQQALQLLAGLGGKERERASQRLQRATQRLFLAGLDTDRIIPSSWCGRTQELLTWLVKEDASWILLHFYMKRTVDIYLYAQQQRHGGGGERANEAIAWAKRSRSAVTVDAEYQRLRVVEGGLWRLQFNENYQLCPSYPATLCLPACLEEDETQAAASQRSKGRLAALVWIHPTTKTPLCRASQPLSGLSNFSTDVDRKACLAIKASCPTGAALRIADARPRLNAGANALQGKGFESVSALGGPSNASLVFLDIENIHSMRGSLSKMKEAVVPTVRGGGAQQSSTVASQDGGSGSAGEAVQASKWLVHVSSLLRGSACVAESILAGHPVLQHCSDGWDRTSQCTALAQLLLDPFYRTTEGLFSLVAKEWCAFGHRFESRIGGKAGHKETSPVFLQFLDCAFQLTQQFPASFEFSPLLLQMLAQACISGAFVSFRGDSERERVLLVKGAVSLEPSPLPPSEETWFGSVFVYLRAVLRGPRGLLLVNPLYTPEPPEHRLCRYLKPRCATHDLSIWRAGLVGCFPHSLAQSGPEGTTAAEAAAAALQASRRVARLLWEHRNGGVDPALQLDIFTAVDQAGAPPLFFGEYTPPALRRPRDLRPIALRRGFFSSAGVGWEQEEAGALAAYDAAFRRSTLVIGATAERAAERAKLLAAARSILLFLRAAVGCLKASRAIGVGGARRWLFALALHEQRAAAWAGAVRREAAARFVRSDVVREVVEDALQQALRTEHAQGFTDASREREERRSSGSGASSVVSVLRKLALGGEGVGQDPSLLSPPPPLVLVPPTTASSSIDAPPPPALSPPAAPTPQRQQPHSAAEGTPAAAPNGARPTSAVLSASSSASSILRQARAWARGSPQSSQS